MFYQPLEYSYEIDTTNVTKVLLVDRRIPGYKEVMEAANDSTFVIAYSVNSDHYDLISLLQDKFVRLERLGIMFPSSVVQGDALFFREMPFFVEKEKIPYSPMVEFLVNLLLEFSITSFDFLTCSTLMHPEWNQYFYILRQETGVEVSASGDDSGLLLYGKEWSCQTSVDEVSERYFSGAVSYVDYVNREPLLTEEESGFEDIGEEGGEDWTEEEEEGEKGELDFVIKAQEDQENSSNKYDRLAMFAHRGLLPKMTSSHSSLKKIRFGDADVNKVTEKPLVEPSIAKEMVLVVNQKSRSKKRGFSFGKIQSHGGVSFGM